MSRADGEIWTSADVEIRGLRTHYIRTGGSLPPMVLAHGATDSAECWASFIHAFARDFDVIAYDARGHGRSEAPESGYTTVERARDLEALLDALEAESPILVGHSMGGQTVGWLAAERPDLPRAIVLEDAGVSAGSGAGLPADALEKWRDRLRQDRARPIEDVLAELARDHPNWPDVDRLPWAEAKQRLSARFLASMDRPQPRVDLAARYAEITCPALFLKADAPESVRRVHHEKVSAVRHGRVVHVEGAGHNVRRDRCEAAIEIVRSFLAEL